MSLRRVHILRTGGGGLLLLPPVHDLHHTLGHHQVRTISSTSSSPKTKPRHQQTVAPSTSSSSSACPLSRREAPLPRQRRNGGPLPKTPPTPPSSSPKHSSSPVPIPSASTGPTTTTPSSSETEVALMPHTKEDVLELTDRHNKRTSTLVATMRLGDTKLRTRASTLLLKSTDELCEMMDALCGGANTSSNNSTTTTTSSFVKLEELSTPLSEAQARLQAILHLAVVRHPLPSPVDAAHEGNALFLRIGSLSRIQRQYISGGGNTGNVGGESWERGLGYLSLLAQHRPTTLSTAPDAVVVELIAALEARHKQQQASSPPATDPQDESANGVSSSCGNGVGEAAVWMRALSLVHHLGRVGAEPPAAVAQWVYTVAGKTSGQVGCAVRQINNIPVRPSSPSSSPHPPPPSYPVLPTHTVKKVVAKSASGDDGDTTPPRIAHSSRLLPYAQRQVYTTNSPYDDSRHTSMPLGGGGGIGSSSTTLVRSGWTTEASSPNGNGVVDNDEGGYDGISSVSTEALRKGDIPTSANEASSSSSTSDTTIATLDRERSFAAGVRKRRLENALRIAKEKAAKQKQHLLADADVASKNDDGSTDTTTTPNNSTAATQLEEISAPDSKTQFTIWDDISKGLCGDTFEALRRTIEVFMVDRDERFSAKLTPRRGGVGAAPNGLPSDGITGSTASINEMQHTANIISLLLEDNAAREVVQNAWGLQASTLADTLLLPVVPEEDDEGATTSNTSSLSPTMRSMEVDEVDAVITIRGAIGTLASILRVEGMMLALHVRSNITTISSDAQETKDADVSSPEIVASLTSMSELFTHLSHLVAFIVTELPSGINHHHDSTTNTNSHAMMMRKGLLNPLMDLRDALVSIVEGVSRPLLYPKHQRPPPSTTTPLSTSISSIHQLIVTLCNNSLLPPLQSAITASAFMLEASSPQLEDHVTTHRTRQARSIYFTEMMDNLVGSMAAWRETLDGERAGAYRNYCRNMDDDDYHHHHHHNGSSASTPTIGLEKKNLLLDLAIARHLPLRTFSASTSSSSASKNTNKKEKGIISAFQRIYTEGLAVSESMYSSTSSHDVLLHDTSPKKSLTSTPLISTSSSSTSQLVGNCILRFALVDMAVSLLIPTTHIDPSKWDATIGQIPEAMLSEAIYGAHRPLPSTTSPSPLDLLFSSSVGIGHVRRVNQSLHTLLHQTNTISRSGGGILQTILSELGPGHHDNNTTATSSHHHQRGVLNVINKIGMLPSPSIESLAMDAALPPPPPSHHQNTRINNLSKRKANDSTTPSNTAPSAISLLRLLQKEPSLQSNDGGGLGVMSVAESACEECLFSVAVITDHIGVSIPTTVFSSLLEMYGSLPTSTTSSTISAYGAIATRIVRNTSSSATDTTYPGQQTVVVVGGGAIDHSTDSSSSLMGIFRSYLDSVSTSTSSSSSRVVVDPWALAWVRKHVSEPVGALFTHPTHHANNNKAASNNNVNAQKQMSRTLECLLSAGKHIRVFNSALLLISMQTGGGGVDGQHKSIRSVLDELHNGPSSRTPSPTSKSSQSSVSMGPPVGLLLDAKAVLTYSVEVSSRVSKEISTIERNRSTHSWLLSECFKSWDDDLVGSLMFAPSTTNTTTPCTSTQYSTVTTTTPATSNTASNNANTDDHVSVIADADGGTGVICGVDALYGYPGALSSIPPPSTSSTAPSSSHSGCGSSASSSSLVSIIDDVIRGLGGCEHDPIWVLQELMWNTCVCITLAVDICALIANHQHQQQRHVNPIATITTPIVNGELYTQLCGTVSHITLVSSVLMKSLLDEFSKPAYAINRNDERGTYSSKDRNGEFKDNSMKMWVHRGERLAAYQEVYNILPQLATGGLWRLLRASSSSPTPTTASRTLDDASLSQFIVVESRQRPSSLWSKSLQLLTMLTTPSSPPPRRPPPSSTPPPKQLRPIRIELLVERLSATLNYSPLPYRDKCMMSMRLYAYARAMGMETHRHTLEETMGNFYESCCLRPYFKSSLFALPSSISSITAAADVNGSCSVDGDLSTATTSATTDAVDNTAEVVRSHICDDDALFDGASSILSLQKSPAEIVAGRIIASNPSLFISEGAVPSWCNAMRQLALVSLASSKADTNNMLDLLEANAKDHDAKHTSSSLASNSGTLNTSSGRPSVGDGNGKSNSEVSSNERLPMNRNMNKSAWTLMHRLVGGGGTISDAIKPSLPATGSTSAFSSSPSSSSQVQNQQQQADSSSVAFSALKMSLLRSAGAVQLNEVLLCSSDSDPNQLCRFNELLRSMRRDHTGSTWAAALSVYSVRAATVGVRHHHRIILSDIAFPVNETDDDVFRITSTTANSSSSRTSQQQHHTHPPQSASSSSDSNNKFSGMVSSNLGGTASVQAGFTAVHQQLRRDCALLLSSTRHALTPKEVLLLCKALSWPSHVPPPLPNRPFIPPQPEEAELASEDRARTIQADIADLEAELVQNDLRRKNQTQ